MVPERTDYSQMTEGQKEANRSSCNQSWQELRDGKMYSCNYAAYVTVAGIVVEQDLEEAHDLTRLTSKKKS